MKIKVVFDGFFSYFNYLFVSVFVDFSSSANEVFDATYPTNVLVSYNGFCHWVPPGMFKSTCQIDIAWFPFDDQKCTLKFGSWTHDGRYLDLQLDGDGNGDTSSFIRNGEWKLIGEIKKTSIVF